MENKIEALCTAHDYIDNLENGILSLSDNINGGNEEKGIGLIPLICDGIDWLIQVISLTEDIHNKKISIEELKDNIQEIVEAMNNEDYILVGDLFRYEISPILNNIKDELKKIVNV